MFWGDVLLIVLAVVVGLGVLLVAAVVGVVVMIVRAGSGGRKLREQEEQLLHELHQGLLRMDARVDALETILLAEESKKAERMEV